MESNFVFWITVLLTIVAGVSVNAQQDADFLISGFRPPATPLVTMDPYTSVWSCADNLTDDWPRMWTGTIKALVGMIRVDGVPMRFMGPSTLVNPPPDAMQQVSVQVLPTRTIYQFVDAGISLNVTFMTPLIPTDYDLLSRPVTYITFDVASLDGKQHNVQIYYDNTAEISVNTVDEEVAWNRVNTASDLVTMRMGTSAQNVLGQSGDWIGIDWGYVYVSIPSDNSLSTSMYGSVAARSSFFANGTIPSTDDTRMPRPCEDNWPVLAAVWNLGSVSSQVVSKYLLFAYDDIYSIEFFGDKMQSYWHQNFDSMEQLLQVADAQYERVEDTCEKWDFDTLSAIYEAGGSYYATIASLAYRQTLAGCKVVWNDEEQTMWYFLKEISSDGDVQTVDVVFPASPFFIVYNPDLLRLLSIPILVYANNETSVPYTYDFAPHHLGLWPIAYIEPDQQENMPIEETGNLMLMIASVAQLTNSLEDIYPKYWPILQQWGEYLVNNLPDPGNQLCTDDFEGPTPHDSNLAVKGIVAIDAFAYLNQFIGNQSGATHYHNIAITYAKQWIQLANPDNSDHYRLRFDQPGWSLKYNLLYQEILNLTTFPQPVFNTELNFYSKVMNTYGVPLDNRHSFTKYDWESWVASFYQDPQDWNTWAKFLYNFANETPNRVPLTDWYDTITANQNGFQARPVVGGIWAKMANPQSPPFGKKK